MNTDEQLRILQKQMSSLEFLVAALMRDIAQVKGRLESQSQQLKECGKLWTKRSGRGSQS